MHTEHKTVFLARDVDGNINRYCYLCILNASTIPHLQSANANGWEKKRNCGSQRKKGNKNETKQTNRQRHKVGAAI